MKKLKILYCVFFFCICLVPSVGMLFTEAEQSLENRNLSEFPELINEQGLNIEWLSQAGDYFQEHFALRNEMVTANALINGKLLETSTASGVIQGSDGWLYYTDSLADYLGTDPMSDRSLFNVAHMLSMMQKGLNQKGVNFLFTVAPNKNSLYGEHMPYYDSMKVSDEKNLFRLKGFLEEENVNYADLYETLSQEEETLYHKTDSHWNNKGAALAADTLLNMVGKEHYSYVDAEYEIRRDFEGDLDKMLYPLALTEDDEIYYKDDFTYQYVEEIESTFDTRIHTTNPAKDGSLVMYRDSFGNALLPFMAEDYGMAYFSRGVPYQLSDVDINMADTVIVERAERFLPEMAQSPPVMEAVPVDSGFIPGNGETEQVSDGAGEIRMVSQGLQKKITGRILPEYLSTRTRIYIRINDQNVYEAFPMDIVEDGKTDSGGFCLYIPESALQTAAKSVAEPAGNVQTAASEPVGNMQAASEPVGNVQTAASEPVGNQQNTENLYITEPMIEILCETDGKVVSVYKNIIREELKNEE